MSERLLDHPAAGVDPLLRLERLKTWLPTDHGNVRAVDGVDLQLARGATIGIVGESGSGKSVLVRSIAGIVPPTALGSGSIFFDGVDLRRSPAKEVRGLRGRAIGLVLQDPMTSLNPVMRIGKHLTESLSYHLGLNRHQARARALELLDAVRIPDARRRLEQYPHEMSGGMRQRITIAIAIACEPRLLLADEPTTALDVTVQQQILDLFDDLRAESDLAIMLVTHDLGIVANRVDHVAVMYGGRVVEDAPTEELFARPLHPYTQALLAAIPRMEYPSHTRLQTIAGRPPVIIDPGPGCSFAPRCAVATDRCLVEQPVLAPAGGSHAVACFYPGAPAVAVAAPGGRREWGLFADHVRAEAEAL